MATARHGRQRVDCSSNFDSKLQVPEAALAAAAVAAVATATADGSHKHSHR